MGVIFAEEGHRLKVTKVTLGWEFVWERRISRVPVLVQIIGMRPVWGPDKNPHFSLRTRAKSPLLHRTLEMGHPVPLSGELLIRQHLEDSLAQVFGGLARCRGKSRLALHFRKNVKVTSLMTNRVAYAPQDFQKMCKQAERDHEAKKLSFLIERVKRQIAERGTGKHSTSTIQNNSTLLRLPSRSVPLER